MQYGIKDAAAVHIKKKSNGKMFLYSPYANVTTNEWTSDRTYAMANGVRAIAWDHNKQSTLKMELEVFELKWIAMLAGSSFVTGATNIIKREVLTVSVANKASIAATPVVGSLAVFKLKSDLIEHDTEQTAGTPATNVNEYSISSLEITFNATSCPSTTKVVVYYLTASAVTAQKLEIKENVYPENFEIWGDTMITDKNGTGNTYVQIHYPNAKPIGSFTITMSESEVTKLDITFDLFPDENNNIANYTII